MAKGVKKSAVSAQSDEIQRAADIMAAKQQFVSSAFDMGWRMALTVIVPVFIGAWLDRHFHSSPRWTIIALLVGIVGAAIVVWLTIKNLPTDTRTKKGGS